MFQRSRTVRRQGECLRGQDSCAEQREQRTGNQVHQDYRCGTTPSLSPLHRGQSAKKLVSRAYTGEPDDGGEQSCDEFHTPPVRQSDRQTINLRKHLACRLPTELYFGRVVVDIHHRRGNSATSRPGCLLRGYFRSSVPPSSSFPGPLAPEKPLHRCNGHLFTNGQLVRSTEAIIVAGFSSYLLNDFSSLSMLVAVLAKPCTSSGSGNRQDCAN